jgi:hypothetical protein
LVKTLDRTIDLTATARQLLATALLLLLVVLVLFLAACTGDNTTFTTAPPPAPPVVRLPGEPAQYVCLRRHVTLGCTQSEWRCPLPLVMRAGFDGTPRCVMPGTVD